MKRLFLTFLGELPEARAEVEDIIILDKNTHRSKGGSVQTDLEIIFLHMRSYKINVVYYFRN